MPEKTVKMSRNRRFTVILQKEEVGGYSVRCIEIPQALSQGETRKEALENMKEAIQLVLEYHEKRARALKGKEIEFAHVVV